MNEVFLVPKGRSFHLQSYCVILLKNTQICTLLHFNIFNLTEKHRFPDCNPLSIK